MYDLYDQVEMDRASTYVRRSTYDIYCIFAVLSMILFRTKYHKLSRTSVDVRTGGGGGAIFYYLELAK